MHKSKLVQTLAIVAGSAALIAQTGFAQPSSLSITNPVVGLTNVIWDFSKLTNELQTIDLQIQKNQNQVEIQYPDPVTQDGRGRISGGPETNTVSIQSDAVDFQGIIISRGSVSGNKGVTHLTFATRTFGKVNLQGALRSVSAGANYSVQFDVVKDLITLNRSEHASAAGLGSISEAKHEVSGFSTNADLVAELGDGTWTLVLNFDAADVNKLSGNATVTLESGQVYPFTFTGVFAPTAGTDKHGQSKINLKGVDAGTGCILQVTLDSANNITRIVGRISGQTVNIKQ